MFESYLVEILLSVVLMFNVGAYTFLWTRQSDLEDDVEDNSNYIQKLRIRIFGYQDDSTAEGHLEETKNQFEKVNGKLDEIEGKIDHIDEQRRMEHKEVRSELKMMVNSLSEEESLDFNKRDYSFDDD